jgi:hypothetical protein
MASRKPLAARLESRAWERLELSDCDVEFLRSFFCEAAIPHTDPPLQLKRIRWMTNDLLISGLIDSEPSNRIVLQDEGLLQRALGFYLASPDHRTQFGHYLKTVRKPAGVICVMTDEQIAVQRETIRGSAFAFKKEYIANSFFLAGEAERLLAEAGVAVIRIDGNANVSKNLLILDEFVSLLHRQALSDVR